MRKLQYTLKYSLLRTTFFPVRWVYVRFDSYDGSTDNLVATSMVQTLRLTWTPTSITLYFEMGLQYITHRCMVPYSIDHTYTNSLQRNAVRDDCGTLLGFLWQNDQRTMHQVFHIPIFSGLTALAITSSHIF